MTKFHEFDYSKGIVSQYYKNIETNECITKARKETQTVHPYKHIIELMEEPSESARVTIKNKNVLMSEVRNYSDVKNSNQYYVDYESGKIYFHSSIGTPSLDIDYMSVGGHMISYNKIYTELDEEGNIVDTLKNLIEGGKDGLTTLREFGTGGEIIKKMQEENSKVNGNVEKLKTENNKVVSSIETIKSENAKATTNINSLTAQNTSAKTNIDSLSTKLNQSKTTYDNLKSENDKADINITSLKSENKKAENNIDNLKSENAKADLTGIKADLSGLYWINSFKKYLCGVNNDGTIKDIGREQDVIDKDSDYYQFIRMKEKFDDMFVSNGGGISFDSGDFIKNIGKRLYPVGSIILTTNASNPSTTWGGKWERWGQGKVPVGCDSSDMHMSQPERGGGSKTVTHTHTSEGLTACIGAYDGNTGSIAYSPIGKPKDVDYTYGTKQLVSDTDITNSRINHGTRIVGSADETEISVMQPYVTCYMWKRVE